MTPRFVRSVFASVLATLVCLAFSFPRLLVGKGDDDLTVDWIYSTEGKEVDAVPAHHWLDDGRLILLDLRLPKKDRTLEIYTPESGKREVLVNKEKATQTLEALLDHDSKDTNAKEEREEEEREVPGWPEGISGDGRWALYLIDADLFVLDLKASTFSRATKTAEEEKSARFSPDSKRVAFVRKNGLFTLDLESMEETSLTKTGTDTLLNGTYDDNVHIQNTWAFVDRLIKAGKLVDMMIYPMRKHGISDDPARIHLFKTMLAFWERNL